MIDFGQLEQQNGLPSGLLSAVMQQESGGDPNAVSPKGAMGAFQFMPQTAQQYGINPNDPNQSAQGAAKMLGDLSQKYGGSIPHVLAGYNWGQGNVDRQGLNNAPPETKNYIQSIMGKIGNSVVPEASAAEIQETFDVQMPDGTLIRGVPKGTTQSQIQDRVSKLQPQQQAGQPATQGPSSIPDNTNNLTNNQTNPLQSMSAWANSPTNVDLSDLPQSGQGLNLSQKLGYAAQAIGRQAIGIGEDAIVKPTVGGVADLMSRMKGGPQAAGSDISPDPNILSGNELGDLAMLSPASAALRSKMGFGSIQNQSEPIGNLFLKFGQQPTEVGKIEDQSINKLMIPDQKPEYTQGSSLMQGFKARSPEELNQASDALLNSAGNEIQTAKNGNVVFSPERTQEIKDAVNQAVNSNSFIPEMNPKTLGIVNKINSIADNGNLELKDLQQYRTLLNRVAPTEDGVSAASVKRALDDVVNSSDESHLASGSPDSIKALQVGRANYANASRFEDIADIVSKANGDPNRIKQGLTNFLKNDSNTRGWTQDQIDAVKYAANTGIGENILKMFGKFGIDFSKSGTGNTVLPALMSLGKGAGALAIPGGIPAVMAATAMRQGQKYIARGKAEKTLQFLQNGGK